MLCRPRSARPAFERRAGRSWSVRRWDDLRLAGLKLIFLVVTRAVSVLSLSQQEAWWKDAEILMLRHQLAVALRERPRAHSRFDVAGPGVAGHARRDAAHRPARSDTADRHPGNGHALAS